MAATRCGTLARVLAALPLLMALLPPQHVSASRLLWADGALSDPLRVLMPFAIDWNEMANMGSVAKVDWRETPDAHQIVIDVPGLRKDELKVEINDDGVLSVSGERQREEVKEGDHWRQAERLYGKFMRRLRLPNNANLNSVKASLEDGVLTVTLTKLAPEKVRGPRLISIDDGNTGKVEKLKDADGEKTELR